MGNHKISKIFICTFSWTKHKLVVINQSKWKDWNKITLNN